MTPARRCALASAVVAAVLLALHALVPDAAARRVGLLGVLLPTGYAHQLAAWLRSRQRARERDPRAGASRARRPARALRCVAGWTCLASGALLLEGLAPRCWPLVALGLAFVAAWHVFENELAMAHARSARLPPLPRAASAWALALGASAVGLGLAASLPWWTHALLEVGVPPRFACWTAEEGIAALLLHHVVSWGLFVWERAAVLEPVARRRRRRALLVSHAAPGVAAALLSFIAPAVLSTLAAPGPYLMASVAHALHTARERRG